MKTFPVASADFVSRRSLAARRLRSGSRPHRRAVVSDGLLSCLHRARARFFREEWVKSRDYQNQ